MSKSLKVPEATIRTTMLVGHPGETEAAYQELLSFVKDFRFERLGVFTYSHEEGTWGHRAFKDELPMALKEQRAAELMSIQQDISESLNRQRLGHTYRVLFDRIEGDYAVGRTEFDSPEVDQEVLVPKAGIRPGRFHRVRITRVEAFDLYGEQVE